ncbi:MAG: SDR family NAD(P)-dependent oxidoreductase [Nannocystales bacterium]
MTARLDTIIITGASSGIGYDLARRFLAEGASVVLCARDPVKLEEAGRSLDAPDRVEVVAGDVGEASTGVALREAAIRRFGGVDVLVNNAGIYAPGPFLEASEEQLDAFVRTNLKGTFLVSQAVIPALIERGGGSVLNVGTVLVEQPMTGLPVAAVMASKGGVHALTRALAAEFASRRVRVNAIAPGIIRTPLIDDPDSLAGLHPLGRVGEVQETSEAALFLARSEFVTGTILAIDGGYAHAR